MNFVGLPFWTSWKVLGLFLVDKSRVCTISSLSISSNFFKPTVPNFIIKMQKAAFAPKTFRAGVTARPAARTAVKVYATSRVDRFSKDDVIVSRIHIHV